MKFRARRHTIKSGELDIAPFLNVFFIILIFFMFSSSFIFQPGMKVSLPKAVTSEVVSQENVVLIVTKDDAVYLGDKPVDREEMHSQLKLLSKNKTPLLIKADRSASLGRLVEILDMCRLEGLSQVSMATVQEVR